MDTKGGKTQNGTVIDRLSQGKWQMNKTYALFGDTDKKFVNGVATSHLAYDTVEARDRAHKALKSDGWNVRRYTYARDGIVVEARGKPALVAMKVEA
jgi:hypothetical protein